MATVIPENAATFSFEQLVQVCGGRPVRDVVHDATGADAVLQVRGVVTDSRAVRSGQLYVALRGENHDGHAFLAQAAQRGAAAALVSDATQAPLGLPLVVVTDTRKALGDLACAHRLAWGGRVVAITGSAGKTTTKEITAALLSALGRNVLRTQGNLNNDIGVPMTLLCLEAQHDVAVIEIGTSGPGEIANLARIASPNVGVVTTVSLAHTAGLGSLEAVADEKHALLSALPRDGVAIYSADSAVLRARVSRIAAERVLAFGEEASAGVRLERYALTEALATECVFRIQSREYGVDQTLPATLGLCGQGPALDAAAALAVVLAEHGPNALSKAAAALRAVVPVAGRLAPKQGDSDCLIIDDSYNANPASMAASLETLAQVAAVRRGRAVAVLGDMAELGDHAKAEHARIGEAAMRLGVSVLIGCGPQMRDAAESARRAAAATKQEARIEHVADPEAAATLVQSLLAARDAVLIKGSRSMGMERAVNALVRGEQS
jgi:UDP-N-acetylmuramoyl-tripeptide--D-alanyl-D-alanine ligase